MGESAERAGVSVEAFSALAYAAKFADVSTEKLEGAFQKLNKSIGESVDPTSETAGAFKYLGVEVKNADGSFRSADKVLLDVATSISKLPDGVNKANVAVAIFGNSGADLLPLLNQGADGIKLFTDEAERMGAIVSTSTANMASDFNDTLDRMSGVFTGLGLQIAEQFLPTLNAVADELFKMMKTEGSFQVWSTVLGDGFKWLVRIVAGFVAVVNIAVQSIAKLGVAAYILATEGFEAAGKYAKEAAGEIEGMIHGAADFQQAIINGSGSMAEERKALENAAQAFKEQEEARKAAAKAAEQAAKQRERLYQGALKQLEEEKAGVKNLSSEEKLRYQTTEGSLKVLTTAQKAYLVSLAKQNDAQRLGNLRIVEGNKAVNDAKNVYTDLAESVENLRAKLSLTQEFGQVGADIYDAAVGPIRAAKNELRTLSQEMDTQIDLGNMKRVQEIQVLLDAKANQIALLEKALQSEGLTDIIKSYQDVNRETTSWNSLIESSRSSWRDIASQTELVWKWLGEGTISAKEFELAIRQIDEKKFALMKSQVSELEKKTADFAGQIQSTFGDVFYNMMQGNFNDIGTMFKQMLDKMVAEALAAKLAQALFGDFTRTGSVSGSGGGALTSLVGTLFSGMFRADGGSVSAGQPYIVGEKRPELFVPRTSGTILPDTSALAMAGGNNVQFSITAMDSQDVLRAMDKIKRPLADMMNGTNRAYNLG